MLTHTLSDDANRVIVIGAGLAGSSAAAVLVKQNVPVTLIDPRSECPPVFKAEKIESHQAGILRRLGLLELLLPFAGRIHEIRGHYNGRLVRITRTEQYGVFYRDMVNAIRTSALNGAEFKPNRVLRIASGPDVQRVVLDNGEELSARLIVLASGLGPGLPVGLGWKREMIRMHHSIAIAHMLTPRSGASFPFDAVTYFSIGRTPGLDYLTLFKIGNAMRANLFFFPRPAADGAWTRRFLDAPEKQLEACFPQLRRGIGDYSITGRVESSIIHLYRTQGEQPHGVVMIGDAAQNACPSTGMGLSKVFTDVELLCKYVPQWLATGGMGRDKLSAFSNDPRKLCTDNEALRSAHYRRNTCTGTSWRSRLHRARLHFEMQFGGRTIAVDDNREPWTLQPTSDAERYRAPLMA